MYFLLTCMQENYGCHFYSKAVNTVRGMRESYDKLFERFDIIVMPTIKYKPPVLPKVGLTVTGNNLHFVTSNIFTARCYACAVYAMALCQSVESRCSIETAKHRITQTKPHDSSGTLVFWPQRSPRNSTGVTRYGETTWYRKYGGILCLNWEGA